MRGIILLCPGIPVRGFLYIDNAFGENPFRYPPNDELLFSTLLNELVSYGIPFKIPT